MPAMKLRELLGILVTAATVLLLLGDGAAASTANGLPSKSLTPGAINKLVTQATIHSTICVSGYTKTIRPPSSYTTGLKRQQLATGYNLNGNLSTSAYEEDHLVPLEVGGSPRSVQNLWPEPRHIYWGASVKDRLENRIHALVCDGSLTLAQGQRIFETNWEAAFATYVGAP
jgi:hypothetical protein